METLQRANIFVFRLSVGPLCEFFEKEMQDCVDQGATPWIMLHMYLDPDLDLEIGPNLDPDPSLFPHLH